MKASQSDSINSSNRQTKNHPPRKARRRPATGLSRQTVQRLQPVAPTSPQSLQAITKRQNRRSPQLKARKCFKNWRTLNNNTNNRPFQTTLPAHKRLPRPPNCFSGHTRWQAASRTSSPATCLTAMTTTIRMNLPTSVGTIAHCWIRLASSACFRASRRSSRQVVRRRIREDTPTFSRSI